MALEGIEVGSPQWWKVREQETKKPISILMDGETGKPVKLSDNKVIFR